MMPHQVLVEPFASRDAWGNPTYGALVAYQGRIVNKRTKVINRQGNEVISNTTIFMTTASGISIDDRITLPSGYYPARPPIIGISRFPDEYGAYYSELYA